MKKIFNVAFVCISIIYPFGLFFIGREVSLFMSLMWGLKALIDTNKTLSLTFCAIFGVVALSAKMNEVFDLSELAYFYPTAINCIMFFVFFVSLRGESFVTKIAKMRYKEIDEQGILYTRKVTKIWCVFFALNAICSAILATFENKIYWSIFCGAIAYIIMGLLFGIEWIYRMHILKRKERVGGKI